MKLKQMCITSLKCWTLCEFALINLIKYLKIYKCPESILCKEAIRRKLVQIYIVYDLMRAEEKKRDSRIRRNARRFWVSPIFNAERRLAQGASNNLLQKMIFEDTEKFFNFFRVIPEMFQKLSQIVSPRIQKQFVICEPISARTCLQICLRYVSLGDSMVSVSYAFRAAHNTVSKIISEICDAICDTLKDTVFVKATEDNWRRIADEFEEKWNFPNCIGAIDGKHMILQAPPNSGSMYYNYKGTHSLVLMAVADANYRISLLDIGAPGRRSDGGVFNASEIGKRLQNGTLSIPLP